ncbi:unnamed protein product [Musa acuminata subsp. malaccensis]|uniref:(wild Malaysian banana) hypothetical protein n=1 Tax=Musa acuminata subsp. malaccensis TaxID=214687 RepID=A0A8D6ZS43_MUSAM|nr:unnamed protein product [Musa acuminata subsp. malaccensis]
MDGSDCDGDARTFKVNFTTDGLAKLRERVKEKLKEFMGDYTDDTLAEYVVVLLRNGRRKDEARKELNVFLGDDSATFVSWLWDHLSSNICWYVQQEQSFPHEVAKSNTSLNELSGRHNSQQEHLAQNVLSDSGDVREKSSKVSRIHHSREWKEAQDDHKIFPLRSVVTNIFRPEDRTHRPNNSRRSRSPRAQVQRKRNRDDEHLLTKRDSASHSVIDAPRRLLQFAVRDAVRTVQQLDSRNEPALKRLRSVVSTSTTDSLLEKRSQRITSGSRVPGALSMALKAVAEAVEDVNKARCSSSVFDRLGHDRIMTEPVNELSDTTAQEVEYRDSEDNNRVPELDHSDHPSRSEYDEEFDGNLTILDQETETAAPDYASNNDKHNIVKNVSLHDLGASQSASSAKRENKSVIVEYSIAQEPDEILRQRRLLDQEPFASSAAMTSNKTVNISVNVNTWKSPHYQVSRDATEVENRVAVGKSKNGVGNQNVRLPKENDVSSAQNVKAMELADVQQESPKPASAQGSYTTGRPLEDGDSRTLFVGNASICFVHFAATKDTLSRHFNKFGDVLKVIIINDAATGQPTGSAYVEFLKKESADLALSLNGTSFMSRILKVVRRSSHEAAPMICWPRVSRASSFASRLGRIPYPRVAGAFPLRLPIKTGARSLQWKRDSSAIQPGEVAKSSLTSGNNILSPTARSLTYRRTESKSDGTSGTA